MNRNWKQKQLENEQNKVEFTLNEANIENYNRIRSANISGCTKNRQGPLNLEYEIRNGVQSYKKRQGVLLYIW